MFWVKTLRVAAAGLLAVGSVTLLVAGLAAQPGVPQKSLGEKPAVPLAEQPTMTLGNWALTEWRAPNSPDRGAILTIAAKDGKPAITAVKDPNFEWQPKELTVTGRRVTFTITRGQMLKRRFDGLFDPTNPNRVLGSVWDGAIDADRAVLELLPPGGTPKPQRPKLPAEFTRYLEMAIEDGRAASDADGPTFASKPATEQAVLRAYAKEAHEHYLAEAPKLFRKLVAEQPDSPFGYEAAMQLIGMVDQLKPTKVELDAWVKAAGSFAALHGPQFEAATLGKVARTLARRAEYAAQARQHALHADKLAKTVGMPATCAAIVSEYDAERAAWASQSKAPPAGATWTAGVKGRVTDAKGNPVSGAEVLVNNTQWVKMVTDSEGWKTKTGPDGRYAITLKCQGQYRLHVTGVWAQKTGFIRKVNSDRHKLLPGESATIDFTLQTGELFGGTIRVPPDPWERNLGPWHKLTHLITVSGPGVNETVLVKEGERFELTLPAGTYTVELLDRKKLTWTGLKTGRTDHVLEAPAFQFTPETVAAGFDEMWKSMDRNYSYFTLKPDVDWGKLRDQYRPKAVQAKSADELTTFLTEMLGHLKDGHVWITQPGDKVVGTHRTPWTYTGNRKVVLAQLSDVTQCGDYAIVGKTKPDGFGYFLMTRQSAGTPELVAKATAAIGKLADAPGFVIDLRNANGGSEPLAQEVARLFCEKKVVYAKSRYRDGPGHDEFTEHYPRELPAAKSGKPYLKPVVCLLGPGCVSSGEGFAQMLAALPHVITVGLPTRGSSGNPNAVEVGDTGLVVYFSRWVDLMPDGTAIEGKGIQPKVVVETTAEATKDADPTLAKGLEVLRAKASGGKRPCFPRRT
jgi:hypothetical protein